VGAAVDVAVLSPGPTLGWRRADEALVGLVREAGATCALVRVSTGRAEALRRHPVLIDLVEALGARHSASRLPPARAVVISTVTASFLQRPRLPYAIRFDAPAALNRPGWEGAWQRAAERRALVRADVLLPWSAEATSPLALDGPRVIPLGVPIEPPAAATPEADIDVLAYTGNPHKRRLDVVCAAWARAGAPGRLVIGGVEAADGREWLRRRAVVEPARLEWAGIVPRARWLELLARARVFVNASRFEDHGLAPLEALSAGALLVTVPSPGPYPALRMARRLAPDLVAADATPEALARALTAGLSLTDADRRAYARRADELLAPHRAAAISRTVSGQVLPALGIA
jgi:glycosyltransferase involved in cell wall biosynthesis